jgi:hypothetical protein
MLGPAMDGGGPIAAADDGADGDDGDIDEQVFAIARVAGVVERFEVRGERADVDELGHGEFALEWVGVGYRMPKRGERSSDRSDRIKDNEPKAVAPDYPGRTVMRAGRGGERVRVWVRQESLGAEEAIVSRKLLDGTLRGIDPRPAELGQRPEASLAWRPGNRRGEA